MKQLMAVGSDARVPCGINDPFWEPAGSKRQYILLNVRGETKDVSGKIAGQESLLNGFSYESSPECELRWRWS